MSNPLFPNWNRYVSSSDTNLPNIQISDLSADVSEQLLSNINFDLLLDDTLNSFFMNSNRESSSSSIRFQEIDEIQDDDEVETQDEDSRENDETTSLPELIPLQQNINDSQNAQSEENSNSDTASAANTEEYRLRIWKDLINNYNYQIEDYQRNIRSMIRVTERLIPVSTNHSYHPQTTIHSNRSSTQATNSNTNSNTNSAQTINNSSINNIPSNSNYSDLLQLLFSNTSTNRNRVNLDRGLLFEFDTPLLYTRYNSQTGNTRQTESTTSTTPTAQEVENATEILICDFSNNPLTNTVCPITLEEFRNGEILMRIRSCGHIFKSFMLQRWFLRNSHCPSCRYDIRNSRSNRVDRPATNTN